MEHMPVMTDTRADTQLVTDLVQDLTDYTKLKSVTVHSIPMSLLDEGNGGEAVSGGCEMEVASGRVEVEAVAVGESEACEVASGCIDGQARAGAELAFEDDTREGCSVVGWWWWWWRCRGRGVSWDFLDDEG